MKWKDPKEAELLANRTQKTMTKIEKKNTKIDKSISSGKLLEKQLKKQEDLKMSNNVRISNLKQSLKDIELLGKDENTYAFRHTEGGEHHVVKEDGVVYIETSSDAFSIHEITHVRQSIENGGLSFSNNRLKNIGSGIKGEKGFEIRTNAEIEAYKMQYSYEPSSYVGRANTVMDITAESVGNIKDNNGQLVYPFIKQGVEFINQRNAILGR